MIIEQLYTKCLSQGAYFIESNGEAAVIDPLREIQTYIDLANSNNAKIKYVFETHFHADFVSGHVDLAKKTGASIVYSSVAKTGFEHIGATHNQEFKVGNLTIRAIHTPGHTPESACYLLIDENGEEQAIFTGDTLFLGDVGRPDLAIKGDLTQDELAGMLFDSLRNEIMTLPDHLTVYPAHGAGSSCGKNMSSDTTGNLGEQKATNYALRANMTKAEFIKEVTTGILPPPQYFPKNALMNKQGTESLESVLKKGTKALSLLEFENEVSNGALILDVRSQSEFIQGFIPNSLFIGLNGTFAMWVGALISDINQKIVLVCPTGMEEETIVRMARVGYDNCIGFLDQGFENYKSSNKQINTIPSISAETLLENFESKHIVDVRKPGEWEKGHLQNATFYPLDYMMDSLSTLHKDKTHYIYCGGGYRSVIAISILMQHGYKNLIDVAGGWGAISKLDAPIISSAVL